MNIEKAISNFKKNGFEAVYFETKEKAAEYLDSKIDGVTVSYGGSMTIGEMNILPLLAKHNTLRSHWKVPEGMTKEEVMKLASSTDVYLTSANGASENGELVNIDGTGNRVASTLYGHKKVYFIVGKNKFEENLEKAIFRARNISAPRNAQRLCRKTPCAVKADRCYDCDSPERICRGFVVHTRKMTSCETEIIIIGEDLGY